MQVESLESEKQTNARVFDELSAHDSRMGQELLQQKVCKDIFTKKRRRSVKKDNFKKVGEVLKNYFVNSFSSSLGLKTGKNNPWPEENGLHGFMLRLGLLSVDCTVALFHVVQQLFWL